MDTKYTMAPPVAPWLFEMTRIRDKEQAGDAVTADDLLRLYHGLLCGLSCVYAREMSAEFRKACEYAFQQYEKPNR